MFQVPVPRENTLSFSPERERSKGKSFDLFVDHTTLVCNSLVNPVSREECLMNNNNRRIQKSERQETRIPSVLKLFMKCLGPLFVYSFLGTFH